jgi:hypothetical protein
MARIVYITLHFIVDHLGEGRGKVSITLDRLAYFAGVSYKTTLKSVHWLNTPQAIGNKKVQYINYIGAKNQFINPNSEITILRYDKDTYESAYVNATQAPTEAPTQAPTQAPTEALDTFANNNNKLQIPNKDKKDKKDNNNTYEQMFDEFYSLYPKKKGKVAALRAYQKLKPSDDLHAKILDAVEKNKDTESWIKNGGQFIPYPATFINQKRWEDEIENGKDDRFAF